MRVASDGIQQDRVAPAALTRLLDGDQAELRASIRAMLQGPESAPVTTLPTAERRARVYEWARSLAGDAFAYAVLGAPSGRRDAAD